MVEEIEDESPENSQESIEPEIESPPEESRAAKARRTTTEIRVARQVRFFGPLPRPEILKAYEDALPGCADRVVAMAERQSAHRQALEKRTVDSNCDNERRGQYFAFILGLVIITGGVYLLAQGKSIQGFAAIIIAVGSLAGALIYNRTEQKKERVEKSHALAKQYSPAPPTESSEAQIDSNQASNSN